MRYHGFSWLLLAGACNTPNPYFGLMTEDAGPATSSGDHESSTTARPTTSGVTTITTSDGADTTGPAAEATSLPTTDADTSTTADATTDPSGTSTQSTVDPDTGGPMWECPLDLNPIAGNMVKVIATQELWTDCDKQLAFQTIMVEGEMLMGHLKIREGACSLEDEEYTLDLGTNYPALNRVFCGKLRVAWTQDQGCKIAAFTLEEIKDGNLIGYLYGRYHSPAPMLANFPVVPQIVDPGSCGCPNFLDQDCCPFTPGQHALQVVGELVGPGETAMIGDLRFTNWNAHIYPECIDDPTYMQRVDWFAAYP